MWLFSARQTNVFDCSFLHLDITLYLGCKLFEGRGVFNFQWYIPIGTVSHRLGIPYAALLKMTNYCCFGFFNPVHRGAI